jgi:ElaB/YqjD/DUF883 family membrane-anchored ribosome-binding protein
VTDAHQVRIAQARGEADAAKARLMATVEEAKARLAPKTLAGHAVQAAKDKSIVVADDTVTAVKEKPAMVAGIAGATALLIARKPLFRGLARWWRGDDQPDDTNGRRTRALAEEDR